MANTTRPVRDHVGEARAVERARARQHDPKPEKKPERIAPHGNCAAAADGNQRDHGETGAEREQCHDAAVESVGEILAPVAEGRVGGREVRSRVDARAHLATPTPNPSPQGGGEPATAAARQ